MPSELLVRVAKYVRDLTSIDEQLIRIGRQNFEREQFETGYVVVDGLGPLLRTGELESYDGTAEQMTYGTIRSGPVTLDFYGPEAYNRADEFSIRTRSQASRELQTTLGIAIHQPKSLVDVKALTGQQYGERIQVEMTVEMTSELVIDTLRIDTLQSEIRTEDGTQHAS